MSLVLSSPLSPDISKRTRSRVTQQERAPHPPRNRLRLSKILYNLRNPTEFAILFLLILPPGSESARLTSHRVLHRHGPSYTLHSRPSIERLLHVYQQTPLLRFFNRRASGFSHATGSTLKFLPKGSSPLRLTSFSNILTVTTTQQKTKREGKGDERREGELGEIAFVYTTLLLWSIRKWTVHRLAPVNDLGTETSTLSSSSKSSYTITTQLRPDQYPRLLCRSRETFQPGQQASISTATAVKAV